MMQKGVLPSCLRAFEVFPTALKAVSSRNQLRIQSWKGTRLSDSTRSQSSNSRKASTWQWAIHSNLEDKEETPDSPDDVDSEEIDGDKKDDFTLPSWASTLGGLVAWAAFLGYGLFASPDQTPARDAYFTQKIFGLLPQDEFQVNTVFTAMFFLLGILPFIYASLVIPAAQSKNKIPAWPFLSGMFVFGNFAFLPYAALWEPDPSISVPPSKQDLEGWNKAVLRVTESTLFPALLFFPAAWLLFQMASCGGQEWLAFYQYFEESRLVHVSTLDFISLVLLAPFWMNNDATSRKWQAKEQLLPLLSCLPLLGPIVYLILRPKGTR